MMNRTKTAVIAMIALVGLVCTGLVFARWGQGPMAADNPAGQQVRRPGLDRLIERLELTDEQADALKAIFKEHYQTMKELRDKFRDLLRAIREELATGEPDEGKLVDLIAQAKAVRDQMQAERDAFRAELDEFTAGLSVKQQAQFLLFEARMSRRMHRRMGRRSMMEGDGPVAAGKLAPVTVR